MPLRARPRRLVVPLANNSASSNVVLPDRYGPTRATQRGALGIEILPDNPGLAASRRGTHSISADRGAPPPRRQSESGIVQILVAPFSSSPRPRPGLISPLAQRRR